VVAERAGRLDDGNFTGNIAGLRRRTQDRRHEVRARPRCFRRARGRDRLPYLARDLYGSVKKHYEAGVVRST